MNILGINGSIGWDGNIGFLDGQDYWVHGSGATLFIDGELKGSISEERLTRLKYDGGYPKTVIEQLLLRNNLTADDIDIVGYVSRECPEGGISFRLPFSKTLAQPRASSRIWFNLQNGATCESLGPLFCPINLIVGFD